jgi:hypothetical protein
MSIRILFVDDAAMGVSDRLPEWRALAQQMTTEDAPHA